MTDAEYEKLKEGLSERAVRKLANLLAHNFKNPVKVEDGVLFPRPSKDVLDLAEFHKIDNDGKSTFVDARGRFVRDGIW
jgi:hypothetical protein